MKFKGAVVNKPTTELESIYPGIIECLRKSRRCR
jgi:hypothetical protein